MRKSKLVILRQLGASFQCRRFKTTPLRWNVAHNSNHDTLSPQTEAILSSPQVNNLQQEPEIPQDVQQPTASSNNQQTASVEKTPEQMKIEAEEARRKMEEMNELEQLLRKTIFRGLR